jgi:hypothetical protein
MLSREWQVNGKPGRDGYDRASAGMGLNVSNVIAGGRAAARRARRGEDYKLTNRC